MDYLIIFKTPTIIIGLKAKMLIFGDSTKMGDRKSPKLCLDLTAGGTYYY